MFTRYNSKHYWIRGLGCATKSNPDEGRSGLIFSFSIPIFQKKEMDKK